VDVYIEDLIAPNYDEVMEDVLDHRHSRYVFKGGRGSLKSSFVAVVIVMLLVKPGNEHMHALCLRQTANTLRESVYGQIIWAISMLGLEDQFIMRVSPMKVIRKGTNQEILFRGLDDPMKLKSLKLKKGYIGITWFEEADTFRGMKTMRNVLQSTRRGGQLYWTFWSFNPPETRANFMNEFVEKEAPLLPDCLVHHSTYETVPVEWLGQQFIDDAEYLRTMNPRAYAHEYLGEVTGTGGEVFENLRIEVIPQETINSFEWIYEGLDFGWHPDPTHWVKMSYSTKRHVLYIFDELRVYKTPNADLWRLLQEKGVTEYDTITADSAEPRSIADLRSYGANCRSAQKGPGSVRYGTKWLQSLNAIIIDPVRCTDTADEFLHYEYDRDKEGNVIGGYPDHNNHSIDAVRYGMEPIWQRKGL